MTTELLIARAAALLEAAESMIGMLRDHSDEIAIGEGPHLLPAADAYIELQQAAHALRLHFDSPNTDSASAFDALVAMHAMLHEEDPQIGFDLSFLHGCGWTAMICDRSEVTQKAIAYGLGETTEEACENALDQITAYLVDIPESEVPY